MLNSIQKPGLNNESHRKRSEDLIEKERCRQYIDALAQGYDGLDPILNVFVHDGKLSHFLIANRVARL